MNKIASFSSIVPLILVLAVFCSGARKPAGAKYLLYVGTYTKGDSKGIYAYRFDAKSGDLTSLGLAAETENPSFLAVEPTHHFLYAVNELTQYKGAASGAVTAFSMDPASGKLSKLNEVASHGADPCYISFDRTGKYALVANYTGGSVAVFPIANDGHLEEPASFVQHVGVGKDPERQEGPHAHWIETTADNRFVVAADLGLDELLVYRFDPSKGSLTPHDPPFAKVKPGAGPRHVTFHPNGKFAYVIDEMGSSISSFSYDAKTGVLHPLADISTLPAGFKGPNDTAEIHVHPNGKFLFGSNRGHDSIVVFSIDPNSGSLKLVDHFSTQGKTPRNFEIDPTGAYLFVANQDSGTIVVFTIDPNTGRLTPTGKVLQSPSPVSLRFVPAE